MSPEVWTIDCETRPHEVYSWGMFHQDHYPDQLIRPGGLMMFCAKKYGGKRIESHCEWDDYDAMVQRAWDIYDSADYLVSYNGRGFDNKHFAAAWALAGMAPPSPWRDLDLLKTVRKFQLPSRKLVYVAKEMGVGMKADSGGLDTWKRIIRPESEQDAAAAQRHMVRYCKQDVRVTEALLTRLLPWIDGMNVPLYMEDDGQLHCTRCNSVSLQHRGRAYTTAYAYQRYRCNDCGGWMRDKRSEPLPHVEFRSV